MFFNKDLFEVILEEDVNSKDHIHKYFGLITKLEALDKVDMEEDKTIMLLVFLNVKRYDSVKIQFLIGRTTLVLVKTIEKLRNQGANGLTYGAIMVQMRRKHMMPKAYVRYCYGKIRCHIVHICQILHIFFLKPRKIIKNKRAYNNPSKNNQPIWPHTSLPFIETR